jgi:hypothetical protein
MCRIQAFITPQGTWLHITWDTTWVTTWVLTVLPEQALVSVAARFLVDIRGLPDDMRENIAYHMEYHMGQVAQLCCLNRL